MNKNEKNTVKLTLDPNNPPPLTDKDRAELEALTSMPEERIDYRGAPYIEDAQWIKAAELNATKKQITLRIDSDVLEYFRHTGRRYQTRINAVLRSYVNAHKAHAK
ncbi:MAG: BrnA antitoxin family protein [Burkholderiaceae bacterium]